MIKDHRSGVQAFVPVVQKRMIRGLIAIVGGALLSGGAFAADYVWTTGSGYWTNPAMWGGANYPGQLSSADTAEWTNTVTMTVTEDASLPLSTAYFRNPANAVTLQINSSDVLTVTNSFLIGDLSTSTGSVALTGSGTLAVTNGGTAQFVVGQGGQGTFASGGNLICDQFLFTNNTASATKSLLAGTSGTATLLNGSTWYVNGFYGNAGNGLYGTWNLLGGTNLFTNVTSSGISVFLLAGKMVVSGTGTVLRAATGSGSGSGFSYMLPGSGVLLVSNGAQVVFSALGGYTHEFARSATSVVNNASMLLTNVSLTVGSYGSNGGSSGGLIVTNNAYLAEINGPYVTRIGYDGDNNLAVVTGNSTFTNSVGVAVGYNDGVAAMKGNSLLIATGGKVSASYVNIGYNIVSGTANNSNSVVVSGATSVLNTPALTVGLLGFSGGYNNAVVTGNALSISNGATIYASSLAISAFGGIVGSSTNNIVSNNYVTVNSGSLYATTKLTIGNGSNEQGYVSILNGGLLEANIISNNTAVAGSYVTNNGGIYQFTTATPTLVPNGAGNIALNNGWISFHAVTNVDVTLFGQTTALTFSGTNTFRLNAATNTAAANQTYVFDPGLGATNYAGLEMINGATRYRGQAGNSLAIGQSVGSGGHMLCSNTAAEVDLIFTNNGALTLFNSTLTFATNATFNGALHIDANHLLSLNATLLASNLTLGAGSSLVVTGAGTNATLITYTTLSGGFSSLTAPAGYGISVGNGQIRLVRSVGTCCFFH